MGTCDLSDWHLYLSPNLGWEDLGIAALPRTSPQNPQASLPTLRPDLRLWAEACLDPGPSWGCRPLGWLLYSSHCLPWSLSIGSNTWNQASALESVPTLPPRIMIWMLQGLVYSFSDPFAMTYVWKRYQALARCKVPCGLLRVEGISVHFNRSVVRVCGGSDLSEAILPTPGLGTCLPLFSLNTMSSATSTKAHVVQLLRK